MAFEQEQMCLRVYAGIVEREKDEARRIAQLREFDRFFGKDIPDWRERIGFPVGNI